MDEDVANRKFLLSKPEATSKLAEELATFLKPGDCILLEGDLGAGKTHFARAAIQARLSASGRIEDVPSPTFTLVQVYDDQECDIWHCDLYRLSGPDELVELGLEEALDTAICFIEWPDRLGEFRPRDALTISLRMTDVPGQRVAQFSGPSARWASVLSALANGMALHA